MISSKNIFSVVIGLLFCFQISIISAQSVTGTLTDSINILVNREVMQTIQVPDVTISNDNIGTTIITDNTNTVSLSLLSADGSDDTFDVNSGVLTGTATKKNNGQVTFLIKGRSHGTSTLTFSDGTGTNTAKQLVNVIGVEAEISTGTLFGETPLSLVFSDKSKEGVGITITKRTWNFGNDSKTKVTDPGGADNKNKTVEFVEEGVHIVTLEIAADVDGIGLVTDSTSTAVCVFPDISEGANEIKAKIGINRDPFGTAPLSLVFTAESEEGDGITITKRTWDFGNGSATVVTTSVDGTEKSVEFNDEGVHLVTLRITADIAGTGLVRDSVSTAVCVFPDSSTSTVNGVGSVHGVVFVQAEIAEGVTSRIPVPRAIVTLQGEKTFSRITGFRGVYNFNNVPVGVYTIFACKADLCTSGGSGGFVISEGDSLNTELVLGVLQ